MQPNDEALCPFSKPILGNWCQCPHARTLDRCAGKMVCSRADDYLASCTGLVDTLRRNSRFVLGIPDGMAQLTHAQLMKIRCGGLRGMQRVLEPDADGVPEVREMIRLAEQAYGDVAAFPYVEIVGDIRAFSHRRRLRGGE